MSYWVIVFLSCSFNKYLKCSVDYSDSFFETKQECEYANSTHLVRGACIKAPFKLDEFSSIEN